MKFITKEVTILNRKVPVIIIVWFALALIGATLEVLRSSINNYIIFKQSFWHVIDQKNLYLLYPDEYYDGFFYGPVFSLIIAPFAVLPDWLGCILWCLLNAWILQYAIRKLDLSKEKKLVIIAITAIEMMTSIQNVQINPLVGAWIILAFLLVEDEKDFWATLFIAAGFLVKIYGIAALLFFVFSKHKIRFILSFVFWMMLLISVPMLYSSPSYILTSYRQWFETLVAKNELNAAGQAANVYRDISVMGMVRRITNYNFSNLYLLVPAALLVLMPLLRSKQYNYKFFRLSYLAIILITVIIFSTGAESSTYVVAVPGVALWYIMNYKGRKLFANSILVLVFVLTILSPTDLFPNYLKDNFIRPYSLKALPCFIVFILLIIDVGFKNFRNTVDRPTEQ